MIAAILRIGDPVETGWELTVVIVISQVVFLGQLFYRVGLALVPGICRRNGQKHQPDSVSITEIIDFLELIQFLFTQHGMLAAGKLHVFIAKRVCFDCVRISHALIGKVVFPAGLQECRQLQMLPVIVVFYQRKFIVESCQECAVAFLKQSFAFGKNVLLRGIRCLRRRLASHISIRCLRRCLASYIHLCSFCFQRRNSFFESWISS